MRCRGHEAQPETVWLVYATNVAITNGYRYSGPPFYGIASACKSGYVDATIDATTGEILSTGGGLHP